MNRKIKFRAWDDTLHKMMPALTLPEIAEQRGINWYQLTFLQFTECLDKNGQEIYDGDILRVGSAVAPVYWAEGGWHFKYDWRTETLDYIIALSNNVEVLGNIYEHSHLLKVEAI